MVDVTGALNRNQNQPNPISPNSGLNPGRIAQQIIAANVSRGGVNIDGVAAALNQLRGANPVLGQQVLNAIGNRLSPVEQGQLMRNQDMLAGLGMPPITLAQQAVTPVQQPATPASEGGPSAGRLALDLTQIGIDIVGIFEPTPFADGSNAVISTGRAIYDGISNRSWSDFGWGMLDAGISVAGILPYVGDTAKLGRLGRYAETVANAVEMAASSPALRRTLEPGLRAISDAVNQIPADVLSKLPQGAQDAIGRMKSQLDEFFSAGARATDEVAATGARLSGNTLVLDANRGSTFTAGGRTQAIGDAPSVSTNDAGRRLTTDVDGNPVQLRQPATYDSRVVNADGTVSYTKGDRTVNYDQNGFPVFDARADVYLDATHIGSRSDADHFRAANEMVGDALRADPSLAQRMGLTDAQAAHLMREIPSTRPPSGLTWHHHQDSGRMQLVNTLEHNHFSGGHTGGMRLWGGGR